jgi:hypothetical protein
MNMSKYIIFFILALVGCEKEVPLTSIEGKVINSGSKTPIDSVLVTLQDGVGSSGVFSLGSSNTKGSGLYTTTYTNKEGSFKISLKCDKPALSLTKKGYEFVILNGGSGQSIKGYNPGNYTNEILGLWAQAYFSPIIKGKNCIQSDSICFGDGITIPSFYFLRNQLRGYGNGPIKPYADNGLSAFGDKYYPYWIKYQIKGVWHQKIDSAFIKSFSTYIDTIYY